MSEKILKDASNRLERYAWCLTHPWNNKLIYAKTLNSLFFLEDNKDENVIDINTVEYEYIRDFISNCTYFSVLSFDTPKHSFNSLLDFESILEP